jgi:hypothetical protein
MLSRHLVFSVIFSQLQRAYIDAIKNSIICGTTEFWIAYAILSQLATTWRKSLMKLKFLLISACGYQ